MTVTLTPAMEAIVNILIQKEQGGSAAEVLQLALDNLVAQQQSYAEKKAAFNEELRRRLDAADRGEVISQEDFLAHVEAKTAALRELVR